MTNSPNKILWAVDAFSNDDLFAKKVASLLKRWTKGSNAKIEPVYVLSPDQLNIPKEVFTAVRPESEEEAKKRLTKLVGGLSIPGCIEPKLLVSPDYSLRSALKVLLDYARKTEAELIVVGTQSKRGVTRFLFGSFAETLVHHSEIPVLMITPKTDPKVALKHILFATDFSDASKEAYEAVLEVAQRQKLKITIFNKVEYYTEDTLHAVSAIPLYENYLKNDLVDRKNSLERMAELARQQGIKTNIVLDGKPSAASISTSIVRAATKCGADLVAIASQSGPVATTLLGSVARQVIRSTVKPIWIIHPQQKAKKGVGK